MKRTASASTASAKLVGALLVIACLVLGVVGIVLPIIPGLVFIAIAAIIAARMFPSVDARLRRHPGVRRRLDQADRFVGLTVLEKAQVAVLLGVKLVLDGLAWTAAKLGQLGSRRA